MIKKFSILMLLIPACAWPQAPPLPPLPPEPPHPEELLRKAEEAQARVHELLESKQEEMRFALERAQTMVPMFGPEMMALKAQLMGLAMQKPPAPPVPPRPVRIQKSESDDRVYRRGTEYLDKRDWDKAIEAFNGIIERKGTRADGALYWRAFAQNKLGRRSDAQASLAELEKTFPSSRWLNDAKALSLEIQQAAGQPISPEKESDEELKLIAINALVNSDPERAVPLLEKILEGNQPPKMKERALFVLAQSRSGKAKEIVAQFAKGRANPDLQLKAVEYLGVYGGKENAKFLGDIYASTNDATVKRTILHGLMVAQDKDRLLAAAKSESSPDLRNEAIHWLGVLRAQPELWQLYQNESSADVKRQILHALFVGNNTDKLIEIAKADKDAGLRRDAIHWLGTMRSSQTGDALVAIYGGESDKSIRQQVIHSLFIQNNAKALVDIARKETDPNLKKEIVQRLSMMKSKEATDYLMELLK